MTEILRNYLIYAKQQLILIVKRKHNLWQVAIHIQYNHL